MNKKAALSSGILGLAALGVLACFVLTSLAGNTLILNESGLSVSNPQALAQATRQAQAAIDESQARALALETERQAQGAAVMGKTLAYIGGGLFVLILAVSVSTAAGAWLNGRAAETQPNSAGLYPVIRQRTWDGSTVVHDPNRALGPTTIYKAPSLVGAIAQRLGLPAGDVIAQGQDASEQAKVTVTTQAQAAQLMAAATRPAGLLGGQSVERKEAKKLARRAISGGVSTAARMPSITVIDDPESIAHFEQKLLEAGGDDD